MYQSYYYQEPMPLDLSVFVDANSQPGERRVRAKTVDKRRLRNKTARKSRKGNR